MNFWSKSKNIIFIVTAIILAVWAFSLSKREKNVVSLYNRWDKLMLVLSQIEHNYVDTIDQKKIVEKLLPQLLEQLDPHSVYLPPVALEKATESLEGNFNGIGIQFNIPNDTAVVINVISGGPSEKVGLQSGDRIVKVDGKVVAGVKIDQDSLMKSLRGPKGSVVNIDIKRSGVAELLPFSITRDKISVKSVDVALKLADSLGYVKLSKFSKTTYPEFMNAIAELKESGLNTLIFDLRDNSGGYLDQAYLLANEFLSSRDLIVYLEGAHRKRNNFFADGRGLLQDIKLYVIVNENSASSSEIFAGAIQDNHRGTIVGRRSYGKGLVQEPIFFTDNSGIRLTVARYYTPSGRCLQKPYTEDYNKKNYNMDIYERYMHGEMVEADSIDVNGGGIIPDIFVPIDTVGVSQFLIESNRKSLIIKYSFVLADKYRQELNRVKSFNDLEKLYKNINLFNEFKQFAAENGVYDLKRDAIVSKDVIEMQLKGLVGRYTILDDKGFYPYLLKIDNVIDKIEEDINNK